VITSRWIGDVTQGVYHNYHLAMECNSTAYRSWKAQVDGYAELQGVWYAGTSVNYHNLSCNYP
jgi:hypothetical protein